MGWHRQFFWLWLAAFQSTIAHAEIEGIRGIVSDEAGRAVQSARIVCRDSTGEITQTKTNERGFFVLPRSRPPLSARVLAPGFEPVEIEVTEVPGRPIEVQLRASHASESVTVTASRAELSPSESPQEVISLSAEERTRSASLTLDDFLRKVPGFTLFRRSSSLVAHPTSQGTSLRGVGASGASRSLVLTDGIPLNDPFGGWVYWSRVPPLSIDRVEVMRGSGSELYGTDALGGVIQILRRLPTSRTLEADGYLGSLNTSDYSFYASDRLGRHGLSLAGDFFRTDGYTLVAQGERGRVDVPAGSKHRALEMMWDTRLGASGRAYAIASEYAERRENGTPRQTNESHIRSLAAGINWVSGGSNEWTIRAFGLGEVFDGWFSAVAPDRNSELPTNNQRVPAQISGLQATWLRLLGSTHLLLAGLDYSLVKGASQEIGFVSGQPSTSSRVDGRQDRQGYYLQDLIRATERLKLVVGLRADIWENHDAHSFSRNLKSGAIQQSGLESRRDTAWSPKLAARFELHPTVSLRGSISRSFRAPTLNELYRSFRLGNVVTSANPGLGPERATATELGLHWKPRSPFLLRSTVFWYDISNNISNVTMASTPTLISRQRQNLGRSRSRGLETDIAYRPAGNWTFSAGYFLSDATVRSAPQAPALVGLRIPQVPRHQAVLQAEYNSPTRFYVSAAVRISTRQFDDDLNRFVLGSYHLVELSAGKHLNRLAEIFLSCENLLDQAYAVARTPIETLGTPRLIHGGIRFHIE